MNIGFISLGCSKNRVDSEIMMALLKKQGHKIVNSINRADLVVINTCGFINDAKEEAINTIIEVGDLKAKGVVDYIIATGCLSQRYGHELMEEMPELDAVIGISDYHSITDVVEKIVSNNDKIVLVNPPPSEYIEKGPRILSTPPGSAYLKITEGCNNRCAYCAIPSIRGNLRSHRIEDLIDEATNLVSQGVKELVLVGQDTASYGKDLKTYDLPQLLTQLAKVPDLEWIRLMYVHPAQLTNDIIEVIANEEKIVPYIDIPIQHASNNMLTKMNRKHDKDELSSIIKKLRDNIKDLVLRTTVMLGFPGETEDDFNILYEFIEETQFDWLGAFKYNAEENTPAYLFENHIDEELKEERLDRILTLQNKITRRKNIDRIGTKQRILISSQINKNLYIGRGYFQAPEVDGITMVKTKDALNKGAFVDVVLKAVRNYDMIGERYYESP